MKKRKSRISNSKRSKLHNSKTKRKSRVPNSRNKRKRIKYSERRKRNISRSRKKLRVPNSRRKKKVSRSYKRKNKIILDGGGVWKMLQKGITIIYCDHCVGYGKVRNKDFHTHLSEICTLCNGRGLLYKKSGYPSIEDYFEGLNFTRTGFIPTSQTQGIDPPYEEHIPIHSPYTERFVFAYALSYNSRYLPDPSSDGFYDEGLPQMGQLLDPPLKSECPYCLGGKKPGYLKEGIRIRCEVCNAGETSNPGNVMICNVCGINEPYGIAAFGKLKDDPICPKCSGYLFIPYHIHGTENSDVQVVDLENLQDQPERVVGAFQLPGFADTGEEVSVATPPSEVKTVKTPVELAKEKQMQRLQNQRLQNQKRRPAWVPVSAPSARADMSKQLASPPGFGI